MPESGSFQRRPRLALALLAAAFSPATALAQDPPQTPDQAATALQRLQALEQRIQARQVELDRDRAELESLRRELTPVRPLPVQAASNHGTCHMRNLEDFNQALLDPSPLSRCIRPPAGSSAPAIAQGPPATETGLGDRLTNPVPDRPRIAPGISTILEFANRGRASVTYTHPVIYRSVRYTGTEEASDPGNQLVSFRPQLLTISAGLNVPIVKDESNFLSITRRTERADIDVLSGTTLRLGFDFFSFHRYDRDQSIIRLTRFLWRARRDCVTARAREMSQSPSLTQDQFFGLYGLKRHPIGHDDWKREGAPVTNATRDVCSGTNLIDFVLETEGDGQGGSQFKRAPLAADYQAAFWEEPQTAIPEWGFGGSIEYGTTDFKYRQGSLLIGPDSNTPPRITLAPDRTMALAASQTDTEDDWKVQVYGAYFLASRHARRPPIGRIYSPGVMFVGSATYLSAHQFRPGASEVSFCPLPGPANPNVLSIGCSAINIDRPYLRDGVTLSGELRTQFNNVPMLGVFGLAPRYSRRLTDSRQSFELPIYLSANAKGWGSAGIRFRRQWDGLDLLGNEEVTTNEISIFLSSAINFRGN
jgi:hypothetical protein